jgi:hypothetical protein
MPPLPAKATSGATALIRRPSFSGSSCSLPSSFSSGS